MKWDSLVFQIIIAKAQTPSVSTSVALPLNLCPTVSYDHKSPIYSRSYIPTISYFIQ